MSETKSAEKQLRELAQQTAERIAWQNSDITRTVKKRGIIEHALKKAFTLGQSGERERIKELEAKIVRAKAALHKAGCASTDLRRALRQLEPGNVAHFRGEGDALTLEISDALLELNRIYYENDEEMTYEQP